LPLFSGSDSLLCAYPMAFDSKAVVQSLVKAILPVRARTALHRLSNARRIRGRPFPFVVSGPQSNVTLNCCISYNNYGAYCVPVSGTHRPAAQAVLSGRVWEARTLEFMTSRCKDGDIAHAGTFFGDFLPALAAALADGAKVWAFEPNPESYRCAAITIELNALTGVELVNAGLGEQSSSRVLVTRDFDGASLGGGSQVAPGPGDHWKVRGSHTVPIRIVTIDDVVPQYRPISVIQLDVEGYEQRALTGALRTIQRHRPIVIVESMPEDDWMSEHLRPLGYRVTETTPEATIIQC
jgi:FkbM family methyltransferase